MVVDSTLVTTAATSLSPPAAPSGTATPTPGKKYSPPVDPTTQDLLPECVAYLRLLLISANLDAGRVIEGGDFAMETTEMIAKANRRTMDQLAGKVWFYLARAYEIQGRLAELQP
jgi:26S proteasome regulatory subunit N3